jgi:hypothetical protein
LNVLTLVGAPTSVPKFVKVTPATVPLSGPVIVQVVVPPAGPFKVFAPAPPSKLIGMPAELSDASTVNESLPSPLVTVKPETDEIACDCDVPSIVTESSPPETDAEMVCDEPLVAVTFHATGGARPLAVHAVGSGVVESELAGCEVAPSDCVEGVVPAVVPPVEPVEAQPAAVAPVVPCAFGSVPVASVPVPVEVVPATPRELVSEEGGVTTDGSTAPESPVVATSVVEPVPVVAVRLETVPVSFDPTTAVCCCWGGAGLATSCEPPDVIGGVLLDVTEPSLLVVELVASEVLGVVLVVSVVLVVADVVSVVVVPGSDDVEKNW